MGRGASLRRPRRPPSRRWPRSPPSRILTPVALGLGGVFGLGAISKNNDSKAGCSGNVCNAAGYAARHDALSDGAISTVLVGVGAAAVIGGVVLWVTALQGAAQARGEFERWKRKETAQPPPDRRRESRQTGGR